MCRGCVTQTNNTRVEEPSSRLLSAEHTMRHRYRRDDVIAEHTMRRLYRKGLDNTHAT